MAACYYLLNHTTKQYLDYGKLVGSLDEPEGGYHLGSQETTTNAEVVSFLLKSTGDTLEFVSDSKHELDFFDTYCEYTNQSSI
jgi:hypothetical protein